MTDNIHPALTAWASARDRLTESGERLAELNISSQYQRPDDAPEVLAYRAAEMALARAADELYEAARGETAVPSSSPDLPAARTLIAEGLQHDDAMTEGWPSEVRPDSAVWFRIVQRQANVAGIAWLRTHARTLLTGYSQSLDEQEGSEIELGFLRVRLSGAHADLRAAKAEIRRAWQEVHRLQEAGGAAPGAVSPPDSDRIAALTAALRSLITRIRRVGGYATPEEQEVLWEAERCVGG